MKKIISFLLLAAMLIGCMVPAALVSAADAAITVASVEVMEGVSTANVAVSISGNTGVAYAKLVVVYAAAELAKADADATSDLFNTVSAGTERAGTHKDVKNYLPEGANGADYKGFVVELENLDEESGDYIDVAEDGAIVNLPLDLVAPEVGSTYTVYVSVVEGEAFNAAEDEVVIGGELVEGAITYIKDENLGKYDDFTMFFAPEAVSVMPGEKANVDLRIDANPGLWSIRCMIVFPEALSVVTDDEGKAVVDNGSVFEDIALNVGIANLPLTADNLLPKYKEYFVAEGIEMEGYNSLVLYFEPDDPSVVISNSGVLASLAFNTDNAVAGESYEIKVYYVVGDIFRADGGTNFTDLFPTTVSTTIEAISCQHTSTHVDTIPADCGNDGAEKTICDECGTVVSETVIPATGEHAYGEEVEVNAPTCSAEGLNTQTCAVCGDVKEISVEKLAHTPGADATCKAAQTCTVCGEELAAKLNHTEGTPVTVPATCTEDGSRTVSCTVCGEVISEEVITAPGHNYLQPGSTIIVPPTCTEGGYTQKTCQVCGDVATMNPTEPDGHETKILPGVDATCTTDGLTEGQECTVCGEILVAQEVIPALGHNIVHIEAVAPGCHYIGNIEYWYCTVCECFWQDAEFTQVTNSKNVILPALGSDNVVHFDAITPACHYNGRIEYWYCPDCEQFWQDAALTQLTNSKNVILPATGSDNVEHVEAKDPTCETLGNIEYWYCPDCDQYFADEAHTQITNSKNVMIGTLDHTIVHIDAVAPGCHYIGNIEYWYCSTCGAHWANAALTQVTNSKSVILPATGSENLKHVEAKAPTAAEEGNIEYWFCSDCEQFWADEALTQLTNSKNVIVPALGGEADDDASNDTNDDANNNSNNETVTPPTGDNMMWIIIALAVVAMGSVAIVIIRRKRNAQ